MSSELEMAFHARMLELCETASRECAGFHPECLQQMLEDRGGRAAAASLVDAENAPGGFVRLWELGRLDLTVEAEIMRPEWHALFSNEQRARAAERLERYGVPV